ncbi:MAG: hypothetical protein HWN66_02950 [Candidatus Helarchaeota archaeon]|nr:hypothetical protein [Candidatus Helarchaeota archaeon]
MRYKHPKEYKQLKEQELSEKRGVSIISAGTLEKHVGSVIIDDATRKRLKKKLEALPNLDEFYKSLIEALKQWNILYLLADLFFFHITSIGQTWMIEYLLGIVSSFQVKDFKSKIPVNPKRFWENTFSNLELLVFILNRPYQDLTDQSEIQRIAILKRFEFLIKNKYYTFQYEPTIRRNYGFLKEKFKEKYGFSIEDAINFENILQNEIISRFMDLTKQPDSSIYDRLLKCFQFSLEEFKNIMKKDKFEEFRNFLKRLSFESGTVNKDFRSPLDFNYILRSPIFKIKEHYYLPFFKRLNEILMSTFYYDILNDPNLVKEYVYGKGKVIENTLYDFLKRKIPENLIYKNPEYQLKKGVNFENDLIVQLDTVFYIFECKNKKLTLLSSQGDVASIEKDLQQSIISQFRQAQRFIQDFRNQKKLLIKTENQGEIELNFKKNYQFKIVCITDETYGSLAVDLTYLNELIKDLNDEYPFTTNLNDLEIILDNIDSKEQFFDYINIRIELAGKVKFSFGDEMELFGAYLKNKKKLLNLSKEQVFTLNGFTDDLDRKYQGIATTEMDSIAWDFEHGKKIRLRKERKKTIKRKK